jgi:hypothetical protein
MQSHHTLAVYQFSRMLESDRANGLSVVICRWEQVSSLCYHAAPVLSLAHASIPSTSCQLVFSGATDGAVAVWNCGNNVSGVDEQHPVLTIPGLHQSGVNAMSAECLESSEGNFESWRFNSLVYI